MSLPEVSEHESHLTGEFAGICQPVDINVKKKIKELVSDGVAKVSEMKRHINIYVKKELCAPDPVPDTRRFHPTDKDIRNHMARASNLSRFSREDQVNLQHLIKEWRRSNPDDNIFLRIGYNSAQKETSSEPFLFVHQTKWQRRLLDLYGSEICLLDATYKTSRFNLPLFFICVNTNVGYTVVGSFIVANEDKDSIKEGLHFLAEWNPEWLPQYFLTDYDVREISAVEETFPGTFVYLCGFHREQAWERWLRAQKNGCEYAKEELLDLFRAIAKSANEEELEKHVSMLKDTDVWKEKKNLRDWFQSRWLSQKKRWVCMYRSDIHRARVTTTNGLERQNLELKRGYLADCGDKSLSSMVSNLVNNFLPDSYRRYKEHNIRCLDGYRAYNRDIPLFLRNRPRMLIDHCLDRIPPKVNVIPLENIRKEDEVTFHVKSVDSGILYDVFLGEPMPKCSCADWKKYLLPCKHMLAIFQHFPACDWDFLPIYYRECPQFCLDPEILQVTQTCDLPHLPGGTAPTATNTKTTHLNVSTPTSVTADVIRKECLEILKGIESSIYSIENVTDLDHLKEQLASVLSASNDSVEMCDGLPVLPSPLPCRKKNKPRKKTQRFINQAHMTGIILSPSETEPKGSERKNSDINMIMGEIVERDPLDQHEKALMEIWTNPPDDELIIQVGPFGLTRRSFHFIKSTLSDEVMDAYLLLLTKGLNVLHINSVVATSIFQGSEYVHNFLERENLSLYNCCIAAVNEGGHHWVLIIIDPQTKTLLYINPMGETIGGFNRIKKSWCKFIDGRIIRGIDNQPSSSWTFKSMEHSKQPDGLSCGVFVLKFAEQYLKNESLLLGWSRRDISEERRKIAVKMLHCGLSYKSQPLKDISITSVNQSLDDNAISNQSLDDNAISNQSLDDNAISNQSLDDNAISNQSLDDNAISNKSLDDATSENKPNGYDLRKEKSRKVKRKSFVYPKVKRNNRRFCVCNTKNDGRLYWQCDSCEDWFHPQCIGEEGHSMPDKFFNCPACKPLGKQIHDCEVPVEEPKAKRPCQQTSPKEFFQQMNGTSSKSQSQLQLTTEICKLQIPQLIPQLYEIMTCSNPECEDEDHERHHKFIEDPLAVFNNERLRHCFGSAKFSAEVCEFLCQYLHDQLVYLHTDPVHIYTGRRMKLIKKLPQDCALKNTFLSNPIDGDDYIMYVLLKEAMILIGCHISGQPYQKVNEEFMATEITMKAIAKRK